MSSYYKRSIRLLAGLRGAETALAIGSSRIEFAIKKTSKRSNNTAEIRIYNISGTTLDTLSAKDTVITLPAGYEDGIGTGVIFSGDVANITSETSGADTATILELSDGSRVIREKSVSLSMSGNVNPLTAIKNIADSVGLPLSVSGVITARPYQSGFVSYGSPMDAIAKICRKINYSYSVESGVLNIWKTTDGKTETVVSLSATTGLIGSPQRIEIDKKNGWSVKSLLNPLAMPAGRLNIKSNVVSGNLKISTVTHAGDTHGGDWTTTTEGFI